MSPDGKRAGAEGYRFESCRGYFHLSGLRRCRPMRMDAGRRIASPYLFGRWRLAPPPSASRLTLFVPPRCRLMRSRAKAGKQYSTLARTSGPNESTTGSTLRHRTHAAGTSPKGHLRGGPAGGDGYLAGGRSSRRLGTAFLNNRAVEQDSPSPLWTGELQQTYWLAHSPQRTSACSSTVCVAFSCLSGG